MTPLECAAKALFDEEWEHDPTIIWEHAALDEREAWMKSARAVLLALQEPGESALIAMAKAMEDRMPCDSGEEPPAAEVMVKYNAKEPHNG